MNVLVALISCICSFVLGVMLTIKLDNKGKSDILDEETKQVLEEYLPFHNTTSLRSILGQLVRSDSLRRIFPRLDEEDIMLFKEDINKLLDLADLLKTKFDEIQEDN